MALESTQPPVQYVPDLCVSGKPAVAWRRQTTIYSAEFKKIVVL